MNKYQEAVIKEKIAFLLAEINTGMIIYNWGMNHSEVRKRNILIGQLSDGLESGGGKHG
jgi:hypothetical protein